tara:strand:+ start:1502 stop:2053 length:552 start_codon:yes stop_codon:yes gene_type:complete
MPHVLWRGNPYAPIAVVGEAPGKQEHLQGVPWCGPAGDLLNRAFNKYGIDTTEDCFITNVVKARPIAPYGSGKENMTPRIEAVRLCSEFVKREIALLPNLKVIFVAGKPACVGLGLAQNDEPMRLLNNSVRQLHLDVAGISIPCVLSYHTASILYMPDGSQEQIDRMWDVAHAVETAKGLAYD